MSVAVHAHGHEQVLGWSSELRTGPFKMLKKKEWATIENERLDFYRSKWKMEKN